MFRTSTSFSLLQATAAIAILATLLWSMGIPMFRFAQAANVISFSNTLSDSAPEASANHTITFVTPSGVAAGEQIVLTFDADFGNIDNIDAADIDLVVNGADVDLKDGAPDDLEWGVLASGSNIEITSASGTIPANATVTIRIGTNATYDVQGVNQIDNPQDPGSYVISIAVGSEDSGATMVAIVPVVTVTATVETRFDFTITGLGSGEVVNNATTTITSSSTAIAFGVVEPDTPAAGAQQLQVITNAANGFVVTVQTDQQLTSSNEAVIDGFIDGSYVATPALWESPTQDINENRTWGHWGITTDDSTIWSDLDDHFDVGGAGYAFVSASTTPVEVFRHNRPTNGSGQGEGVTRVAYQIEITPLQEAADDYTAILTYVATPIF
jgi:hypothetical protein